MRIRITVYVTPTKDTALTFFHTKRYTAKGPKAETAHLRVTSENYKHSNDPGLDCVPSACEGPRLVDRQRVPPKKSPSP